MKFKIISLIILNVFIFYNAQAEFCFKSFEQDTAEAKAIFIGEIVEINKNALLYRQEQKHILTFKVITNFKGLANYDIYVSIISPIDGCCNNHFTVGSNYLVFAYGNEDQFLWTNDCSNTGPVKTKKEFITKLYTNFPHNNPSTEFSFQHESSYSQLIKHKNQEIDKLYSVLQSKNNSIQTYKYWIQTLIVLLVIPNLIVYFFLKSRK